MSATKCALCGTALKPLWTSWYCPNEAQHKQVPADTDYDFDPTTHVWVLSTVLSLPPDFIYIRGPRQLWRSFRNAELAAKNIAVCRDNQYATCVKGIDGSATGWFVKSGCLLCGEIVQTKVL